MSIRPLSEDVVSQITSSTTIASLNATVCGLLRNSLDASATRISISLAYSRGSCTVEDDGLGISLAEFREEGGLGKRHCMLDVT
jgi:DNA mismatch repair protein MLH3